MRFFPAIILCSVLAGVSYPARLPAQEGPTEQLGERVDQGLERLKGRLQKTWEDIRRSVDELSVRGRVYGRLRWDKALAEQSIDIQVQERDVITLSGAVPDEAARAKAVQLAQDTIGVREVMDKLQIDPHAATSPNR